MTISHGRLTLVLPGEVSVEERKDTDTATHYDTITLASESRNNIELNILHNPDEIDDPDFFCQIRLREDYIENQEIARAYHVLIDLNLQRVDVKKLSGYLKFLLDKY